MVPASPYARRGKRHIQAEKQGVIIDTQMCLNENGRLDFLEGFPSGQRGQTVNLLAQPSEVQILPPPPGYAVKSGKGKVGRRNKVERGMQSAGTENALFLFTLNFSLFTE